jgi:hypothetical protein
MTIATSLGQVVNFIRETLDDWKVSEASTDVWFRGVGRKSHLLIPQIYRPKYLSLDPDDLFYRFQVKGASLQPTRPDAWEWYFIAQHYGLPTQLLDWTDNAYTAVYFALARYLNDMRLIEVIENAAKGLSVGDSVAVGTALANGPPHRSARAALLHTAPTLDDGGKALLRPRMENAGRR